MRESLLEGSTSIRYPDTIIFTGGVNSYISIIMPRYMAECTLRAIVDDMNVTIKRTAVKNQDIIFPLSDILRALWEYGRGNVDPLSTNISNRRFNLAINIVYDNRILKSYSFILINGAPAYDAAVYRDSDRRRGVYWGNSGEDFELFSTIDSRGIDSIKPSWSSQGIMSECYISEPFLSIPTIGTGTPPNGNAEIILTGLDSNTENILKNSNFAEGKKYWLTLGSAGEIVELDGKNWAHINTTGTEWQGYQQQLRKVVKPNTTYTLSFKSKTSYADQIIPFNIYWFDTDLNSLGVMPLRWQHPGRIEKQIIAKITTPANAVSLNFIMGNASKSNVTLVTTEMWVTDIKLEEGDNDNPSWGSDYTLFQKLPIYIDMCPLSERDMELCWYDELGVLCCWRFTEEYNETAVTNDTALTRMEISGGSLYQARTRMTRKQTTYTLHSRKVPRDVVPFIKSILSAPLVWRYSTERHANETMIVEDYKEKDYGRGYVDVVIKVTDTPQSYE